MPLAFGSLSHGTIAFGFFNIDTHLLLLEDLFFFGDDFCGAVASLCGMPDPGSSVTLDGWIIEDPDRIGNLHGAIAGVDLGGFIGAVYARHPFPTVKERFKQRTDCDSTRQEIAAIVSEHAEPCLVEIGAGMEPRSISIGTYTFDRPGFAQLLAYVDRGGYPKWEDGVRPAWVTAMNIALSAAHNPLLAGLNSR